MDVRYSFTAQFLMGATMFAWHSRNLEENLVEKITDDIRINHRAFIVSAILQSVASTEAEISEILLHGPGHHLGSNGIDIEAHDYLNPIASIIDDHKTLEKYDLVLHLLRKPAITHGAEPHQSMGTLLRLRNELVHYKSLWGQELENRNLVKELRLLRFKPNPLYPDNVNFFPHKILSSSCASWAVTTSANFINVFYEKLNIISPLEAYSDRLKSPDVIKEN